MSEKYKYYAFISYTTNDKAAAEDLQIFLETFKLPTLLREEVKRKSNRELPESLTPVFRDVTNLPLGELREVLKQELDQSRFLIVICSPESARSAWVNREVEYFIESDKYANIIPYIIAGNVGGGKAECFPPILRNPPEYRDNPNLDLTKSDHRRENERIKAYLKSILSEKTQLNGVSLDREGPMVAHAKVAATMLQLEPSMILGIDDFIKEVEEDRKRRAEEAAQRSRLFWRKMFTSLGLTAVILTALTLYVYFSRTPIPPVDPPLETHYYADYVEKFGVPIGIFPLNDEQARHRTWNWRIKSKQGIPLEVACVDAFDRLRIPGHSEYVERYPLMKYRYSDVFPDRFPNIEFFDEQEKPLHKQTSETRATEYGYVSLVDFKHFVLKTKKTENKSDGIDTDATNGNAMMSDIMASSQNSFFQQKSPVSAVHERLKKTHDLEILPASNNTVFQYQKFYDKEGHEIGRTFLASGKAAKNFDETYGTSYSYDPRGRLTKITCLDRDGCPKNNTFGWSEKVYTYDESNDLAQNFAVIEWKNADREYALGEYGICCNKTTSDQWGNIVREQYFAPGENKELKPDSSNIFGSYSRRFSMDEDIGVCLEATFHGVNDELRRGKFGVAAYLMEYTPTGLQTCIVGLDEHKKPCKDHTGVIAVRIRYGEDECPRRIEFSDGEGNPCLNPEKIAGWTSEYDNDKNEIRRAFFGIDGEPTSLDGEDPVDSWEKTFHAGGNCVTQTWFYNVKPHPNGCRKWKTTYDEQENIISVEFFDADGKPCLNDEMIARRTSVYNADGHEIKRSFFGADEKPCLNDELIAGWTSEYDGKGNETGRKFFDADEEPTSLSGDDPYDSWEKTYHDNGKIATQIHFYHRKKHPGGYAKSKSTYDERGNQTEHAFYDDNDRLFFHEEHGYAYGTIEYNSDGRQIRISAFDADKKPCLSSYGCSSVVTEYDGKGNDVKTRYLDTNESPCLNKEKIAGWNSEYDDQDREIKRSFFGVDDEPIALGGDDPYDSWEKTFHDNGKMATLTWFYTVKAHPNGCRKWTNTYDERENILSVEYFDADDKPCLNAAKIAKRTSVYDAEGHETRRSFFGVDGLPCLYDDAYSGWTSEYDGEGREVRRAFFDIDGLPKDSGGDDPYDSWEKTFHENGKTATQTWFYTVKVHPNGCRKWTHTYDERGNFLSVEYYDSEGKPFSSTVKLAAKIASEFNENNNEIRRSFHGINGELCLNDEGIAGWNSEYDDQDREIKRSFFAVDGKPTALGGDNPFDSWEKTFHGNGKTATQTWFYTVKAHPNGCRKWANTYDERENILRVEFFDAEGNTIPDLEDNEVEIRPASDGLTFRQNHF